LVIGALLIAFTDPVVLDAWRHFFSDPMGALAATWNSIAVAYGALLSGSLGLVEIWKALGVWLHGGGAETKGQQTVKGGRRTAPLQMTKDQGTGVLVQPGPYLLGNPLAYTAQHNLVAAKLAPAAADHFAIPGLGPFRDHNNGIMLVMQFIVADLLADGIIIKGNLWKENHVGPT
jgi:hypothetical protein